LSTGKTGSAIAGRAVIAVATLYVPVIGTWHGRKFWKANSASAGTIIFALTVSKNASGANCWLRRHRPIVNAVQIRIVAAAHRHMAITPKAQKAQSGATGEASETAGWAWRKTMIAPRTKEQLEARLREIFNDVQEHFPDHDEAAQERLCVEEILHGGDDELARFFANMVTDRLRETATN